MEEKKENGENGIDGGVSTEELSQQIEQLKSDKTGMTEQIKELRRRAQEKEEELARVLAAHQPEPKKVENGDVEGTVQRLLQQERQKDAETNKGKAFSKFLQEHKEFDPGNDDTGMKRDALEKAFSRLNTVGAYSVDDFIAHLTDAAKISGISLSEKKEGGSVLHKFASMDTEGASAGKQKGTTNKLNAEQEKLRSEKGWTVEKYLQMKEKYPTIIL